MSTTTPSILQEAARDFRSYFDELQAKVSSLPEATKVDVEPKLHRLDTMIHALERDSGEADKEKGATAEKVDDLLGTVRKEFADLRLEIETLAQGNPTTLDATLDATVHAMEKAGKTLRKMTGRVSTIAKGDS